MDKEKELYTGIRHLLKKKEKKNKGGKVAIITGASSGIGKSTALLFALVVSFILVSKFLTKKILIPKCFIVAKNALLGGGDDNKDDEKKEKKENNNDNEEDRHIDDSQNKNRKNDDDDDEDEENSLSDCFSLKTTKDIKFGGTSRKCKRFIFYFSRIIIYAFWTFYSVDIYLIFFQLYSDGKGIPFGD